MLPHGPNHRNQIKESGKGGKPKPETRGRQDQGPLRAGKPWLKSCPLAQRPQISRIKVRLVLLKSQHSRIYATVVVVLIIGHAPVMHPPILEEYHSHRQSRKTNFIQNNDLKDTTLEISNLHEVNVTND